MVADAGHKGVGAGRAHAVPNPALVEAAKRAGKMVVWSFHISPVTHGCEEEIAVPDIIVARLKLFGFAPLKASAPMLKRATDMFK